VGPALKLVSAVRQAAMTKQLHDIGGLAHAAVAAPAAADANPTNGLHGTRRVASCVARLVDVSAVQH
jgi:hypothetical protein